MPIQEHCAKERILFNAQQVKQQRGVARLRLELNKKSATVIRLKYSFHYFFCSPLSCQITPKPQNSANFKKMALSGYKKKETQTRP